MAYGHEEERHQTFHLDLLEIRVFQKLASGETQLSGSREVYHQAV